MAVSSVYPIDFSTDLPLHLETPGLVAIYVLVDPRQSDVVRYVGKSARPHQRYYRHRTVYSYDANYYRTNWVRALKAEGLVPTMRVVAWVPIGEWQEYERAIIAQAREEFGNALVNCTDGGEGTAGWHHTEATKKRIATSNQGRITSEETRQRLSIAHAGRTMPDAQRARISATLTGHVVSESHRQKLREARTGKPLSPEHKAKMSAARKGKPYTEAQRLAHAEKNYSPSEVTRSRISASNKGHPTTQETRDKIASRRKGHTVSPETRAKISATLKAKGIAPPR